jgi:CBS domain containing-hemolysin-like protein
MSASLFFLSLVVMALLIQGFFALFEMACVSFPPMRLQYDISLKNKKAIWINYLLEKPSRLFGTTLIGINAALQIGSECARRFYESIHLNPDFAPLTQVFLVVLFGELVPLFAARRHPEQIALFAVPFVIPFARLLFPIIWIFDKLSRGIHRLMGLKKDPPFFLSREEIKMAFERNQSDEDRVAGQIFQLKHLCVEHVTRSLNELTMLPSSTTVASLTHTLSVRYSPFIPLYHKEVQNIVGIAYLKDLLRLHPEQRVLEHARSPWFVTLKSPILDILNQFKTNNQMIAIVLGTSGEAVGFFTFDDILNQIFNVRPNPQEAQALFHMTRTLSAEMTITSFNQEFQATLPYDSPEESLNDLIAKTLGHSPSGGEKVKIGPYWFTVLEPSLTGAKTVAVTTHD